MQILVNEYLIQRVQILVKAATKTVRKGLRRSWSLLTNVSWGFPSVPPEHQNSRAAEGLR